MKVDSNSNEWFATQGEEYVIELQNGKYSGPLVELADGAYGERERCVQGFGGET